VLSPCTASHACCTARDRPPAHGVYNEKIGELNYMYKDLNYITINS
jgi:hypothetical protein